MKIVHIITRMIVGGAQENTLLTCRDLMQQYGDEVTLITGPPIGPEGSLMGEIHAAGISVVEIDALRRAIAPRHDWIAHRAIRRALVELAPQVVHTHSAKGGLLGRYAAWSLGVPAVVHTVHGAPFHEYQGRGAREFFRQCERRAARRCHKLISVADAMTDRLVAARVAPREKFTTIYSGMEVEPFLAAEAHRATTRAAFGFADDEVVVGKIARMFRLKGHDDFITAAARVARHRPEVRFLLVGDGLLRDRLERQIAREGLTERFRFAGLVPPEKIPAMLSAMDLVVHTSLREGLARVLPQALIAGRPVISYDIDGAREVVATGETGILIPPRAVDELAEAIEQLTTDPTLRARLAAEGRRRSVDRFRHETMTAAIRSVYENLRGRRV